MINNQSPISIEGGAITPKFSNTGVSIKSLVALKLARDEAAKIVSIDPKLKTDQGKALRILLHLFKNEVAIDYLKSG